MKKKASLSLSVNAIVILILAIVMLGLGLGFIRGMFSKVSTQVEQQVSTEPEPYTPTASNPITLSREMIITHSGDKEVMKVSAYNPTDATWTAVKPKLTCPGSPIEGINDSQSANPKTVEQGKFVTFNLILTIPSSPPDTHLCQMSIKDYSKDMTIKVIE